MNEIEAIKKLDILLDTDYPEEIIESLEMAIEALQEKLERTQPCRGCIYFVVPDNEYAPCKSCKRMVRVNDYFKLSEGVKVKVYRRFNQ